MITYDYVYHLKREEFKQTGNSIAFNLFIDNAHTHMIKASHGEITETEYLKWLQSQVTERLSDSE